MAGDAFVRSTIRPKHPKGTTSVSAVEREKRGTLTCPCYLLGAITYDYKLYLVWMWYVLDMYHILFYMNYALFGITYYVVYR